MSQEVVPHLDERLILNDVVLVVDASGSTHFQGKFPMERRLLQSFVGAMPDAGYLAGLISFGGDWHYDWVTHSPECFDRENLANTVDNLKWLSGSTPLGDAIAPLGAAYRQINGVSALVIFSDGKSDAQTTIQSAQDLIAAHQGALCIHTVLVGNDAYGRTLLQNLAELSGCGSFREAGSIASLEGMEAFIREVFYGVGGPDLDADGDGVPDSRDRCPNTPKGAPVDEWGCWTIGEALFAFDKSNLRVEAKPVLDEAAAFLKSHPELELYVDGHTDSTGDDNYNLDLSIRRAHSVFMALVDRGVDFNRLVPRAFGEAHPRVPNDTKERRYLNRRVELRVKE
jgi:OOP family OmpA-OmpF porin